MVSRDEEGDKQVEAALMGLDLSQPQPDYLDREEG